MKREIGLLIMGIVLGAAVTLAMWQVHETILIDKYEKVIEESISISEDC